MNFKEWFTCNDARDALYKGGATLLWLLSIMVVLIVVGMVLMLSRGNLDAGYENTITVSGESEIFATPDIATVTFNVTEEAAELSDAQEHVTETMNAILESLEDEDIDEDDIKTQNYSSNPRYEYNRETGKRTLAGYEVRHSVLVKIRDIDQAGEIITLLGSYDVDNMYGPSFDIDDPEALQEEARAEAIADAKEEAKRLAKELDVRLGKLISFNENGGGYMPMMRAESGVAMMAMDADMEEKAMPAPNMPAGEQSIVANVSLTYKVK